MNYDNFILLLSEKNSGLLNRENEQERSQYSNDANFIKNESKFQDNRDKNGANILQNMMEKTLSTSIKKMGFLQIQ